MSHSSLFFFFNDTATTEIYTLSLHDALPISHRGAGQPSRRLQGHGAALADREPQDDETREEDRKSTRLNSSHPSISYAVFCLKKKKTGNELRVHVKLVDIQRSVI